MKFPRLQRNISRTAAPRTATSRTAASGNGKRKTSFTGRAAVLAVVLAALAIALAGPLRELISQRSQVASVRQDVATSTQQLKDLQAKDKLWNDPAYVAAQASERLHYVLPGQVPYVTLSPTPSASTTAAGAAAPDEPWYAQLWSSVQGAAATPHPSTAPVPSAASSSSSPSASASASAKPGT